MQVVADPAAPPHFLFVGFRAQPGGMGPVGEQVGVLALRQRVRLDGSLDNSQAVLVTDEPYAGRGPSGPFRYESDLATNKPEPDVIAVDDLAALGIVPADLDANPGLVTAVPFGTVEINRGAGFGAPINISFGWRLRTAAGEILARQVVLCTSADRPALAPALDRAVLPIRSHIVVTEPLGSRLALAVNAPHAVYDDRLATGYYRPLAGGRLLWGGRVDALPGPRSVEAALRRDLALVFPQLAAVPFAAAWTGVMGFVRHRMPVVRPLARGLWVATGFGGHGLNTTTLAGELVASALVEGDRRWRFLEAFGLPWNGGPLGPPAAQAFYSIFQLRDRIAVGLTGSRN